MKVKELYEVHTINRLLQSRFIVYTMKKIFSKKAKNS